MENNSWVNSAVYDVKYQHSTKAVMSSSRRHNTHQLLFYTLLLNVPKCGFIFPQEKDPIHEEPSCFMNLQEGAIDGPMRHYTQWSVCVNDEDKMFHRLMKYVAGIVSVGDLNSTGNN